MTKLKPVTLEELAELGIEVIVMDPNMSTERMQKAIARKLGEDHQADHLEHRQNKEWTK